ncbi:MAG: hypothetical protein LLG97_16660 [Deltaproteobacteria bacterium]|nr:hypothetical protein [Deltaproteobacteria bacterium]
MFRNSLIPVVLIYGVFSAAASPLSGGVLTKVTVRVVSRDAKAIGSGVGGASVEIVNLETGELLAQGVQRGETGDTDRIMVQPRKRGQTVYGTPGAASFMTEIPLERPTRAEIRVKGPLSFPEALQSGTKTVTLIPGMAAEGEGIIIELDGLIVRVMHTPPRVASSGAVKRSG